MIVLMTFVNAAFLALPPELRPKDLRLKCLLANKLAIGEFAGEKQLDADDTCRQECHHILPFGTDIEHASTEGKATDKPVNTKGSPDL